MSGQSPYPPQDDSTGNDMDDWFSMLSCIVNFLSAAANLAIKLEQNYLISNVTNVRKPVLPLLPAPPLLNGNIEEVQIASTPLEDVRTFVITTKQEKEIIEELTGDETSVENATEESLLLSEQIPISSSYPESECSDLPQEIRYMNTQDMGDYSSTNLPQEYIEYESNPDRVLGYDEDARTSFYNVDQPEEMIKICSSEDTCYFDDFTDSDQTIDSFGSQKHYDPVTQNINEDACRTSNDEEEEERYSIPPGHFEDKSVQAKRKSGDTLPKDTKTTPIKSQEIQTHSTNRFKGRVIELITKSPELQQPIKEAIVEKAKTTKEKLICNYNTVPKNLNELKEQLESIKKLPTRKEIVKEDSHPQEKQSPIRTSRIPVDRSNLRKGKKNEKQTVDTPNATTIANHVPLKSPGTSKRFASVESVVKKLIHGSKAVEKVTEENKEKNESNESKDIKVNKKEQKIVRKPTVPKEKEPEENKENSENRDSKDNKREQKIVKKPAVVKEKIDQEKEPVVEPMSTFTEVKRYPQKEIKTVKNHKDFIYKKNVVPKTEKPKSSNLHNRPASKRTPSRKSSDVNTARSRSASRGSRNTKNTSPTLEATRKKGKELKRALSPNNPKLKNRNDEEMCEKQ